MTRPSWKKNCLPLKISFREQRRRKQREKNWRHIWRELKKQTKFRKLRLKISGKTWVNICMNGWCHSKCRLLATKWSKANFSCHVMSSIEQCSMEKLAVDLLLGLKFVKLEILIIHNFCLWQTGRRSSRSLGFRELNRPKLLKYEIDQCWMNLASSVGNSTLTIQEGLGKKRRRRKKVIGRFEQEIPAPVPTGRLGRVELSAEN